MAGKVFNKIQDAVNAITGILLVIMVFIVFIQVIMRYILGHSLSWSEELTRYMFVWLIYLGVNLGIKGDMQIKIDVLDLALKGKRRKILNIFQHVASLVAIVAAAVGSYYLIQVGFRAISPSLHLPMSIIYVVFPIGFALDFIEVIRRIVVILKGWNDDESKEVAA